MARVSKSRTHTWFAVSVGVILLATGIMKVYSGFGRVGVLSQLDPVIGTTFRTTMVTAGLLELFLGVACFFSRQGSAVIAAILGGAFLVYRLGLVLSGWQGACKCLGTLPDSMGIPPSVSDLVLKLVALYLLSGGYLILLRQRNG